MTVNKKMMAVILWCVLLGITACGLPQTDVSQEYSRETDSEGVPFEAGTETMDADSDVSSFYPLVYPLDGDYDYSFYLCGLYLSSDRSGDRLCIQPIRFISGSENAVESYQIEEYTDETISLPLKPETRFHIINWNRSPEMAEQSLNQPLSSLIALCAFDNPRTFFRFLKQNHGENLVSRPMVLNLDEDGYVDLVVELYVP